MKKNILHAVKIILASVIAILLAMLCQLEFAVSAGIVAILSVALTKRETLRTARDRFLAFGAALLIAGVCFLLMGVNIYAFFVYLILFIILCIFCGWNNAMAMDSVLISHFLSVGDMSPRAVLNETLLFVIGVGAGIIANLFLHKDEYYMNRMKAETDDLIRQALHRMSLRILDPALPDYDGHCFEELERKIDDASALAHANFMNQISKRDTADMEYISMRKKQTETLYEIYKHLSRIGTVPVTAPLLSEFFEKVSAQYSMDNTVEDLLLDFHALHASMKETPLPVERAEFEDRARLFAVMCGMQEFLELKREYVQRCRKEAP